MAFTGGLKLRELRAGGWRAQDAALFWGTFAGFLIGNLTHALAPILIGVLIAHWDMSEARAGQIVAAEFIGIALTAILVGPFIAKLSRRRIAVVGCVAGIVLHVASMFVQKFEILLTLRFLAGLGGGMALAAAGASAAATAHPDRIFALVKSSNAVVMAAIVGFGGYVMSYFGPRGGYGMLAAMCLLAMPLLLKLPSGGTAANEPDKAVGRIPLVPQGLLTVLGTVLWLTSAGACWAYAGSIGTYSGLSIEQVGTILGIGLVIAISGGLTAAWLDTRLGRALPLTLGTVGIGVTWWITTNVSNGPLFVVCTLLNNLAYLFVWPYILGNSALLDRLGRWSSIASTSLLGAMALGPLIGGQILERAGMGMLGTFALVGQLVSLALFLVVLRSLRDATGRGGLGIEGKPAFDDTNIR